ncbi:hypothetical protein [Paracidovorax anthurii]|uniref:Uncharacterized protein n=1 Tax=Paracidovorax anthurii TaxID=78229 RepID=A0A328ZEY3_9BURK|nr:hypothetical protein [Paracidovorax anthurii]RAR84678.1 hypothetical protein AX018_101030 [Paracidovorax anthurii]WCM94573.1 hypothetical protein M5C99_07675 [Acidovorax sp. NCPPB 2350]
MPSTDRSTQAARPEDTSAGATVRLSLRPGEKTLICLPPGGMLRAERGRLALNAGPMVWGQVMAPQAPLGGLEEGQCRVADANAPAVWMEVSNAGAETAQAMLVEPAPVPAFHLAPFADAARILGDVWRAIAAALRGTEGRLRAPHGPETTTAR